MANYRTQYCEWNDNQYQCGLRITPECDGQHAVHGKKSDRQQVDQFSHELLLARRLADIAALYTHILFLPFREKVFFQLVQDLLADGFLQVCADFGGPFAVPVFNLLETTLEVEIGNRHQGYFPAIVGAQAKMFQAFDRTPVLFGVAHHDLHILAVPGQALNLVPIVSLAHLVDDCIQGDTQFLRARLQSKADFLADGFDIICNIVECRKLL